MIIDVNEEKQRAEIWLARAEADNVRADLNRIITEYKNKKYFVAVFYSGERSLAEMTALLLKNNIA